MEISCLLAYGVRISSKASVTTDLSDSGHGNHCDLWQCFSTIGAITEHWTGFTCSQYMLCKHWDMRNTSVLSTSNHRYSPSCVDNGHAIHTLCWGNIRTWRVCMGRPLVVNNSKIRTNFDRKWFTLFQQLFLCVLCCFWVDLGLFECLSIPTVRDFPYKPFMSLYCLNI